MDEIVHGTSAQVFNEADISTNSDGIEVADPTTQVGNLWLQQKVVNDLSVYMHTYFARKGTEGKAPNHQKTSWLYVQFCQCFHGSLLYMKEPTRIPFDAPSFGMNFTCNPFAFYSHLSTQC